MVRNHRRTHTLRVASFCSYACRMRAISSARTASNVSESLPCVVEYISLSLRMCLSLFPTWSNT